MIVQFSAVRVVPYYGSNAACTTHLLFKNPQLLSRARFKNISKSSNVKSISAKSAEIRAGYFYDNTLLEKTRLNSWQYVSTPLNFDKFPFRRKLVQKATTATKGFNPSVLSGILAKTKPKLHFQQIRKNAAAFLALSKIRLTVLVVLTACASYTLFPVPDLLTSSTAIPSISPLILFYLTSGTALCAASANTFNMLYEPQWDALMSRTRNRPLVRGLISTRGARIFAFLTGFTGVTLLYYGVNSTVSFLGLANILMYAGVYTPLKRVSVLNTWVGAVVGGLPPLMGWAAAAGQNATSNGDWKELLLGESNVGGWLMAGLLFAWQFPHFMSLSWTVREEYKHAGYRMLCWVNPARNARVALRYSFLFFPICVGLCKIGVTEWSFAFLSAPINSWLLYEAVKFWRYQGGKGSARGLFWASLWHLPVVMILAMIQKKGMWQKTLRAMSGDENENK